ncbi:hypothetical protein P691DRAFT_767661 [Macrolepiota fuliginosa MF-IS2]|uniref:Uncharacterized protein n=1 Tax=Macrolepiota fuliginosa MF-IS2 TaxID=1400762 RepID=A0A9P6BW87_9AGAR|nr:hypothetical protein P691DRAFT_767661 [Macrolepiota fuliginosa MF-IS2]
MTSHLNDSLPPSVLQLDEDGKNWLLFSLKFHMIVCGKGLWDHFNGTSLCPVLTDKDMKKSPLPMTPTTSESVSTAGPAEPKKPKKIKPPVGTKAEIHEWDQNEQIAYLLLAQRLPDMVFIITEHLEMACECWEAITQEFTYQSAVNQTEMHAHFLDSKCPKDGNV